MSDAPKLRLPPTVSFRYSSATEIEISINAGRLGSQRSMTAPREDQALLAVFVTPRTIAEAYAAAGTALALEQFGAAAARYLALGVLVAERVREATSDLRALLREDVFADASIYSSLKEELRAGHLCIIREAFQPDFAERVWRSLDAFERWNTFRSFGHPFTSASGYRIDDRADLPDELVECERMLDAPKSRELIADLCGETCDGDLIFDPKLFLAGDFFSPHLDIADGRVATFTWHLTKAWQREWGGHFVWCSPLTNINPAFNMLILHRATGYHMITPVTPQAQSKRLAVNAWWTAHTAAQRHYPPLSDWYRGPVRSIAPSVFAVG